jgi:hypothetical protein
LSKIEVNTVAPQCGTTLTLGESGDTVALGSGASQTGFGRTGTVDWQTTPKTATFTAANGEGYFADTSSTGFNMNLPAGSAGAIVSVADYASSFNANNLTVVPNGSDKIGGNAGNVILNTEGQSITLVFVDSTQGWVTTADSSENITNNPFMVASVSGACNTLAISGNCKIATFTGPGDFIVSQVASCAANNLVSYMVVGGGGGSGAYTGGGGGAGGFRETKSPVTPYTASPLDGYPSSPNRITVTATTFPIAVGGGGAGNASADPGGAGTIGSVSTFSTITSAGGGAGGGNNSDNAGDGGSGGGGSENRSGGSGNTPSTTPAQGKDGGTGSGPGPLNDYYEEAGAGGGATTVGGNGTHNGPSSATGGTGATTTISGTPTAYAGGGGGGKGALSSGGSQPQGGAGGGGNGSFGTTVNTVGTINTGGGGGGGSAGPAPTQMNAGKAGGSGIVIIRYKFK